MEKAVDRAGAPTGGWVYIGRFRLGGRCRQRGVQEAYQVKTVTIEVRSSSLSACLGWESSRRHASGHVCRSFLERLTEEERATLNWGSAIPWAGSPELTRTKTGGSQQNTRHIPLLGYGPITHAHCHVFPTIVDAA